MMRIITENYLEKKVGFYQNFVDFLCNMNWFVNDVDDSSNNCHSW